MDQRGRERADTTLPDDGTDVARWTAARKEALVVKVEGGGLALNVALTRYRLTLEEYNGWRRAFMAKGRDGLKATKIQQQRSLPGLG